MAPSCSARSARRCAASARPSACAACARARRASGSVRMSFEQARELRHVEIALHHDPGGAGLLQHGRVRGLMVVHRVRIGNEERGPADHRELAQRGRAAARDHEMRVRHAARQIGEELADLRFDAAGAIGALDHFHIRRTALLRDLQTRRASVRASAPSAAGTSSDSERAPWLPPNTRRRIGPSGPGGA